VLLTTQYLEEADQLAARIAVIDHGRLIAEGTPAELKAATGTGALRVHLADPAQREAAAGLLTERLGTEARTEQDPDVIVVPDVGPVKAATALGVLDAVGIGLAGFSHQPPSLDEVFLALTGHAPHE
jgi:ABC-2 type transport system ATP-binding protein